MKWYVPFVMNTDSASFYNAFITDQIAGEYPSEAEIKEIVDNIKAKKGAKEATILGWYRMAD